MLLSREALRSVSLFYKIRLKNGEGVCGRLLLMNLEEYTQKRLQLKTAYKKLEEIAGGLNAAEVVRSLQQAEQLLDEDSFKVVVVGEFSRGKSTFTNALLGKRILPAKSDPTTTVINRIHYGAQERYLVHYRDTDEVKEISEKEFKSITAVELADAEFEGEAVYQQVVEKIGRIAYIEICHPLPLLADGVEIIDTPGTNDLDQVREEITFRFIPQADAAIMLLSAEQILAKSEVMFLQERILENDIKKVFFVVNFKDRLMDEADGERVMKAAREVLDGIVEDARLFLVSSRDALRWRRKEAGESLKPNLVVPDSLDDTGFAQFEASLADYLSREKGNAKLAKYQSRFQGLAESLLTESIAPARARIGESSQQLAREIERLRPAVERAKQNSHRIFEHLQYALEMAAEDLTQDYRRGLEQISRQVVMAVHRYDGPLQPEEAARAIESVAAPLQQQHERELQEEVNRRLNREFSQTREKLVKIFRTENISTGKELAVSSRHGNLPVCSMDIQAVNTEDIQMVGGGLLLGGVLLAIHVPFIAIPAALFGGNFFMRQFSEFRRNSFIADVSQQVRSRYDGIIPEQTRGFNQQMKKRFMNLTHTIEEIIEEQMDRGITQLERLRDDKASAEQDEQQERERLAACEEKIQELLQEVGRIHA